MVFCFVLFCSLFCFALLLIHWNSCVSELTVVVTSVTRHAKAQNRQNFLEGVGDRKCSAEELLIIVRCFLEVCGPSYAKHTLMSVHTSKEYMAPVRGLKKNIINDGTKLDGYRIF